MQSPYPEFIMSREFLLSIPAKIQREKIERQATSIRQAVYQQACVGKTKYNFPVQNIRMVNGRPVTTNGQPCLLYTSDAADE